ncbi:suppressor of cytokine signaling 2-like [Ostrea edulis]|uniref:suppressor of cytokine signaling 2-like n=1 Tax=Ostrea edulis TaxID=37623 RepID=UPI0020944A41|nr:suppressor of cytokine signaling 2-like [Ostrea edulis]
MADGVSLSTDPGSNESDTVSVKCSARGPEMDDERRSAYLCAKDMVIQIETAQLLTQTGWYYEHFTSKEATKLLQKEPEGTFLIRNSSDSKYLYSLSVKINRGTTNVRILYLNGHFQLDSDERSRAGMPKFDSAVALVDFYARLTHMGKDYNCKWMESSGIKGLSIALQKPKPNRVVDLSHLCRLSIHRSVPNTVNRTEMRSFLDKLPVPGPLISYLKEYPYIH